MINQVRFLHGKIEIGFVLSPAETTAHSPDLKENAFATARGNVPPLEVHSCCEIHVTAGAGDVYFSAPLKTSQDSAHTSFGRVE